MSSTCRSLGLTWFCVVTLIRLPVPAADFLAEWIQVGNGDWTDAANWKGGLVPVSSQTDRYHVVITNTTTPAQYIQCSLDQPMSVSELTLGNVLYAYGGSAGAPPEFEIRDHFRWAGGALSGWECNYHLRGEARFEGDTFKTLDRRCALYIHGHARWTGGHLSWGGYGHASVEAGALFELNTGGTVGVVVSTDSVSITNRGVVRVNAPGETVDIHCPFLNSGALELQAGDLRFVERYEGSGSISVAPDARLTVSRLGSWGPFEFSGGGELIWAGQQEILADMVLPGRLRIAALVLGEGALSLKDAIWEGGELGGTGALLVPADGRLVVRNQGQYLGRALRNLGEVTLAPGARIHGRYGLVHENEFDAILTLGSASAFGVDSAPAGAFINRGTVRNDSVGVGNAEFRSLLSNLGVVRSTKGRLAVLAGGTNFGTFEAVAPGSVRAQEVHFSESSIMQGDGAIEMVGGTLHGQISSNLALAASGVTVLRDQPFDIRQFQVGSWVRFSGSGGVQVHESLRLYGSLIGGQVRSLSNAEISVAAAEIRGGAQLELGGATAVTQGTLWVTETNSALVNRGAIRVVGPAQLIVNPGAVFLNEGACAFNRQIGSLKASVNDMACGWSTGDLSGEFTLENGPYEISGPVVWAPRQISAGPHARLVFSDLSVTNAEVRLTRSTLEVKHSLAGSNALLVLDDADLVVSNASWSGSVALMGHGRVRANLAVQSLQVHASPVSNHLALQGGLSFAGSASTFQLTAIQSNGVPRFPYLQVTGLVELAGNLQVVPQFLPNGSNFVSIATLLESDQPLVGTLANVASGGLLLSSNGFRCRVYYGAGSPYGPHRLVIAQFGTAFDQWRWARFTAEELADGSVAGPVADPDGNGFSNVADFVFALEPPGRSVTLVPPGVDGYSWLQLRRRKDVGGLHARIGLSSDLLRWADTTLGGSHDQLILHRAFELDDCYEYHYLVPGVPTALYLRFVIEGEW